MSVLSEDLVEHWAVVFTGCILVEGQLYDVLQMQVRPCHWMPMKMLDIRHYVAEVIDRAIRTTTLHSSAVRTRPLCYSFDQPQLIGVQQLTGSSKGVKLTAQQ